MLFLLISAKIKDLALKFRKFWTQILYLAQQFLGQYQKRFFVRFQEDDKNILLICVSFFFSGKPNCTHFVGRIKRWRFNFDFRYLFRKYKSYSIDESDIIKILKNGRETKNFLMFQSSKPNENFKEIRFLSIFDIFVPIN